jgi:hypothetical protein
MKVPRIFLRKGNMGTGRPSWINKGHPLFLRVINKGHPLFLRGEDNEGPTDIFKERQYGNGQAGLEHGMNVSHVEEAFPQPGGAGTKGS